MKISAILFLSFLLACQTTEVPQTDQAAAQQSVRPRDLIHGWKFESGDHASYRQRPKGAKKEYDVAKGKLLFERHCVSCHGASGKGDGPLAEKYDNKPSDLTANNWFHKRHFFYMVKEGYAATMPAWKAVLAEADLQDIIAYIRTLSST